MTLIDDIKRDRKAGTPGPWKYNPLRLLEGVTTPKRKRTSIKVTFGDTDQNIPNYGTRPQAQADARRIARVPDMEAALLAAEELARAQDGYVQSVYTYEMTPSDRGGKYGPKGTAQTLMLTKYALMQAALAAYRKATGASDG